MGSVSCRGVQPRLGTSGGGASAPGDVERIEQHHRPYHACLGEMLDAAYQLHGATILLDIHSMPPLPHDLSREPPQIVIGDRFGRTASAVLCEIAGASLEADGLRVAFNAPYAGGHILERHAAPHLGRHTLQLEVDRRLYLDADMRSARVGLARMQLIRQVAEQLSDAVQSLSCRSQPNKKTTRCKHRVAKVQGGNTPKGRAE